MRNEEWFSKEVLWTAEMSSFADDIVRQWGLRHDLHGDTFLQHLLQPLGQNEHL